MKRYMNNRTVQICAFIFLLFVTLNLSCKKSKINLSPLNPTEESYFRNENEFSKAVFGVYAKLSDLYWYNGGAFNTVMPVTYLPGDDITTTGSDEFEQFGQLQPTSGRVNYYYTASYQLIARANVLLEKIEAEKGVYITANLKNSHKGEALFLRGLSLFNLWNLFGTSPVVIKRIATTAEFHSPASKGTELLDQAIKDLTEASTLLPASWDVKNRGRATVNAANGMLGKALVFRGTVNKAQADYGAAIQAFNKIAGLTLVAKFDDNFAFDTENNNESLFEFQASQPFELDNVWLDNDFNDAIGSMSVFWGYYDNNFALFGAPRFIATQKLVDAFDPLDPRRDLTLDAATKAIKKYGARNKLTQSGVGSANNPRILRYADVLLLKAEGVLQSGGSTAEAIGLINQVRTRARSMGGGTAPADYSTTETNKTTIMNWIMKERLLELAGEGQRWFDLRRWHLGGTITLDNAFFSSATTSMSFQLPKHLLFPIPTREIDLNPNVPQNPGY